MVVLLADDVNGVVDVEESSVGVEDVSSTDVLGATKLVEE